VFKLALQLIELMEQLHRTSFIHRDIKPNNFLIGRDKHKGQIYMMDFGLSKKYIIKGRHLEFRDNRSLIGTARYASRNLHLGFEPSRRDDLESVGYMLIYFIKGSLPWQGLKKKKGENHLEIIGNVKMCTSLEILCDGVPDCFAEYIKYCRALKFDETPDYKYLRKLMEDDCVKHNITPKFEWDD
jgi:casein kinase I family protein HRR25